MEQSVKLKRSQPPVKRLLKATFPDYRGRKIKLVFTEQVGFYDTNWSGGTKNRYAFVAADGRCKHLRVPAPWDNVAEGQRVNMVPHVLVVRHSYFCGEDCGITVYAHPSYAPAWLPAGGGQ